MVNLVKNENMKIYRRIRTWILLGLLVVLTITAGILQKNLSQPPQGDWKTEATLEIKANKEMLADEGLPKMARDDIQKRLNVAEYRLAHDIPPSDNSIWGGMLFSANLIALITIFTVVVAADTVAGEFSTGTIKLLLIRPANRAKILLSKYLSTIMFTIAMLLLLFLVSFAINGILYGLEGTDLPYLYTEADGSVHERSMLLQTLYTYGLECVSLLMIVTMAFMISSVFRSSSLSIGISLAVMFLGTTLAMLFNRYWWGKYYLFSNTDLSMYIDGTPPFDSMTLGFSVAVLAVYFAIFNALSWSIFMKRDVAA